MKKRLCYIVSGCLLASPQIPRAQTAKPADYVNASAPIAFDVVSVRQNNSGSDGMSWTTRGADYKATNVPLLLVISSAYDIRQDLISGQPGWVGKERYDFEAKLLDRTPEELKAFTKEERAIVLRAMLADRLKLKVHLETKTLPVYDLIVGKTGRKFKEATPPVPGVEDKFHNLPPDSFMTSDTEIQGHAIPMTTLVNSLAATMERTIIDKTDLRGKYDFILNWKPEGSTATDSNLPTLVVAVEEQLGLKLQSGRGPVDTLVIDHIEKPTEN